MNRNRGPIMPTENNAAVRHGDFIEVVNSNVWAIVPSHLEGLIKHHTQNAADAVPLNKVYQEEKYDGYGYDTFISTAVINIKGPITKDLVWWSDGVSTDMLRLDIDNALKDDAIDNIVLNIDSPGGTIDGVKELSDLIYVSRGTKPIISYANGLMASAAYWIGSAADKIYSYDTSYIGSIGVFIQHVETSKMMDEIGIKTTFVKAGKFKTAGNPYEPLSDDAKKMFQDRVDKSNNMFIEAVARNRGVDEKYVRENMADGSVFNGRDAIGNKLINGLSTFDDVLNHLHGVGSVDFDIEQDEEPDTENGNDSENINLTKGDLMGLKIDKATLQEKFPEVYNEIHEAGKAEGVAETETALNATAETAKAEAVEAAQKEERERASSILALASDSQKEKAVALFADGKSVQEATAELLKDAQANQSNNAAAAAFAAGAPAEQKEAGADDEAADPSFAAADAIVEGFDKDEKLQKAYETRGGKEALVTAVAEWKKSEKLREEYGGRITPFLADRRHNNK